MSSIVRYKWREKNIWAKLSCTLAVVYHFLMENRLSKILFSNPFPKNAEMVNLKNPDLHLIWSIPLRVWILWIHGYRTFKRLQDIATLMFRVKHELCPEYIQVLFQKNNSSYNLRNSDFIILTILVKTVGTIPASPSSPQLKCWFSRSPKSRSVHLSLACFNIV